MILLSINFLKTCIGKWWSVGNYLLRVHTGCLLTLRETTHSAPSTVATCKILIWILKSILHILCMHAIPAPMGALDFPTEENKQALNFLPILKQPFSTKLLISSHLRLLLLCHASENVYGSACTSKIKNILKCERARNFGFPRLLQAE